MIDEKWMKIYDTPHTTVEGLLKGDLRWANFDLVFKTAEHLEYWVNAEKIAFRENRYDTDYEVAELLTTYKIAANYEI